jgi:acylphosphatase
VSGEADVVRRRVLVSGRVQGVFFRDACRHEAKAAGVRGWVRNRGDGQVEAVFEGPAPAVERMIAWCHVGPPRASVTAVQVTEEPPVGEPSFRVG